VPPVPPVPPELTAPVPLPLELEDGAGWLGAGVAVPVEEDASVDDVAGAAVVAVVVGVV